MTTELNQEDDDLKIVTESDGALRQAETISSFIPFLINRSSFKHNHVFCLIPKN